MASVKDAGEAEEIVRSYYQRIPLVPQPHTFRIGTQGYTWIVRFTLDEIGGSEEHEWRIKRDGNVVKKR